MKRLRLEERTARRAMRIWAQDALACDPRRGGSDARDETARRARAAGTGFGRHPDDRIERVRITDLCIRH